MLNNQTLEALHQLKLAGMAQAYAQQLEQPAAHDLSFDERLALLVGAETPNVITASKSDCSGWLICGSRTPASKISITGIRADSNEAGWRHSSPATLSGSGRICRSPDRPGRANRGSPALSDKPPAGRVCPSDTNEFRDCWKICACPKATARSAKSSSRSPRSTC